MLVIARLARVAAALGALAIVAGCSGDPDPAPDTELISVTVMRGALLQAQDIGPTWTPPEASADPNQLVSVCGGTTKAPTVPPGGAVVAAPFADAGNDGAQTLDQTALVFDDPSAAQAGLTALRAVADGCPATVSVPQTINADRSEPAYTETAAVQPLTQDEWTGFTVLRHKQYEAKHPGTADTAVTVIAKRNVLLVDTYAVYRLGSKATSPGPEFTTDWQKLVGTVVSRVG
jgi:hypothetical protein